MKTLAFFTLFELAAACAWGTTLYEYQGEPFAVMRGIYQPGDRITGHFTLDDVPITNIAGGMTNVAGHVVDFAFTDGHQTFTTPTQLAIPVALDGSLLSPATLGRDWFWAVAATPFGGCRATGDCAPQLYSNWYWYEGNDWVATGASRAFNCEGIAGCETVRYGYAPRGTWTVTTPEPATLTLLGVGCVGLVLARRWRR